MALRPPVVLSVAHLRFDLTAELGRAGLALSILACTGVHLATPNLTLILPALVCGILWTLPYQLHGSIRTNIVSHATWAVAIFAAWPMR